VKRRRPNGSSNGQAKLDGALALLGCSNDVAAYDGSAFARRSGELIAKAAAHGEQSPILLPRLRRSRDAKSKSED
jgi:hypothetical protein